MPGFDSVADIYDATRSLPADVMAEAVRAIVAHVKGHSVLDLGVGTGRFAAPLARAGARVVGLDVSAKMIRQASAKGLNELVLAGAESMPLRGESIDYILIVHFLHLVGDWRRVVGEMARVAREGVITVLEDPAGTRARDLYISLREARGFPMGELKSGEHDLARLLRPAVKREITRYSEVFDPDKLLGEYSSKLHSVTWEVPDAVNSEIVREMAMELGGRRELQRSITLAAWNREQLRELHPSA